jgi:signal transduction histidine kinase
VHEVLASARELRAIVQDVADLGALDGGRLQFGVARVNLAALVDDVRSTIGDAAARRGVGFAIDAPDAGAPIASDERRLRQILTCVLGYAMKASRRGSQITALIDVQGEQLRLEVRTTGITVADPQALFADRRDPTPGVPKPYRGPGLGLPLVGRVVHAWGGRADATMADGVLVLLVEVPVHAV